MTILFVEDHARFARLTTREFLSEHEVTIAPSLMAARDALALRSYEVVLVDYDLVDGKGVALVKQLRASEPTPFIVAISSHNTGNEALLRAGADAVCGKLQFGNIGEVLAGTKDRQNSGS